MRHIDVVVIGAGIAGTSLAKNLRKIGYRGTVALVDACDVGGSTGYGLRCTLETTARNHNLPHVATFAGLRDITSVGNLRSVCDVDTPLHALNYITACRQFLAGADVEVVVDTAIGIHRQRNQLQCMKNACTFNYLIDCSGSTSWCRAALSLPRASKYYVGQVHRIRGRDAGALHPQFQPSHITYWTDASGYMEDLYRLGPDLAFGIWHYAASPDVLPTPRTDCLLGNLALVAAEKGTTAVITAEPVLPLALGTIAWLGDSAGQATPASSEGIRPILEASQLLARTIARGAPLAEYQREWIRRNLTSYLLHKAFKDDLRGYNRFFQRLARYPAVYQQLALNRTVMPPLRVLLPSMAHLGGTTVKFVRQWIRYRRMLRAQPS